MPYFLLKGCRRDRGDLLYVVDKHFGDYMECLSCGHIYELTSQNPDFKSKTSGRPPQTGQDSYPEHRF